MPSQFFGLNIAYKGLLASNAALNTTYNNISNEQTEGYSRQKAVQQASNAIRVYQTYGCAGSGVDTIAIERVRDEFYDRKYWNANTSLGEYNMKQYYMAQLETYFTDSSTVPGFNTIFNQFAVNGLQAVYDTDGAYWAVYVNDEYAQNGVDSQPVNDQDAFSLVYETAAE